MHGVSYLQNCLILMSRTCDTSESNSNRLVVPSRSSFETQISDETQRSFKAQLSNESQIQLLDESQRSFEFQLLNKS